MPLGPCHGGTTDRSASDESVNRAVLRLGAIQHACLENLVLSRQSGLGDGPGVLDVVGQWRFAINVLAGLQCIKHKILVFVRRRSNEYGNDSWVVEHLTIICDSGCLGMGALCATQHERKIIANGGEVKLFDVLDSRRNFAPPFTKTDDRTWKGVVGERSACSRGLGRSRYESPPRQRQQRTERASWP